MKTKKEFVIEPIGIIHSLFKTTDGMPIQPRFSDAVGKVEVFRKFKNGLKDINGFSHIMLVYWFHKSSGFKLHARPFLDNKEKGIFAIRSPNRPNPIGISVVKLKKIEDNVLTVEGIDVLDNTPLIDIKPYVPEFDNSKIKIGWLKEKIKKR